LMLMLFAILTALPPIFADSYMACGVY
jgi:hypothetical protein